MKCSNCGYEFVGNFCGKCGTKATMGGYNNNFDKAKALLIDPTEEVKSVLCNNFMQTFISTGKLGKGFAILTDKRIYFKGKCYFRKGKAFYSKSEEKVVDLNDVTGTGFVHNKAPWAKIARTVFLIALAFFTFALFISIEPIQILIVMLICTALTALFHAIYKIYNYSVFEISYAGGGIAFDMNWITQQESKEFQQQIVLLKQKEKEKTPYGGFIKPENTTSIPQQLKEYKELLDGGIITQEEFDAKKQELLTR